MKRNSRVESLRIVCILGITAHHLVYHSTIMDEALGVSRLFAQFFIMFGKSGTNIFVLISAYYLVANNQIDYKKSLQRVVKPWKQVITYGILCGGVFLVFFRSDVNFDKLLKSIFPIVTGHYWFMTAFIGLMFLEPFLNRFVYSLKKADYQKLLIALFFLIILPIKNVWSNDILWFIVLYFTAGYIRQFDLQMLNTQRRKLIMGVGCFALMWVASIFISVLSAKHPLSEYINYFAFRQNSIPMYFGSVAIFLFVIGMSPTNTNIINAMAIHVLPCYLIQSNVFISGKLWGFVDTIVPRRGWLYPIVVIVVVLTLTVVFMLIGVVVVAIGRGVKTLVRR